MEVAFGAIGAASFAIQLVETVEKIRHFVNNVVEAPKEQQRLAKRLDQLTQLLERVEDTSRLEEINGYGSTASSHSIKQAVLNCAGELQILEGYVEKYKDIIIGEGRFKKLLGSLKLAFKENDIHDFENHLQQAIDFLQTVMIADIRYALFMPLRTEYTNVSRDNQNRNRTMIMNELHSSKDVIIDQLNYNTNIIVSQVQNTVTQQLALFQANMMTAKTIDPQSSSRDDSVSCKKYNSKSGSAFQIARRRSTVMTCYQTLLGTMYIRRTKIAISTKQNGYWSTNNTATQTEDSYNLIPAFFSRCFELQFHNAYSSVSRTLRTYPVIDWGDPVVDICRKGSGMELQNYLENNRHRINPFAINRHGHNLLHVSNSPDKERSLLVTRTKHAVVTANFDICKLLISYGVEPPTTDLPLK